MCVGKIFHCTMSMTVPSIQLHTFMYTQFGDFDTRYYNTRYSLKLCLFSKFSPVCLSSGIVLKLGSEMCIQILMLFLNVAPVSKVNNWCIFSVQLTETETLLFAFSQILLNCGDKCHWAVPLHTGFDDCDWCTRLQDPFFFLMVTYKKQKLCSFFFNFECE